MYNELKSYIVNGIFGKVETKTCAGAKSQWETLKLIPLHDHWRITTNLSTKFLVR